MIHPHTELRFISEQVGYGVVATRPIPKGTITWVLDKLDREFAPAEIVAMEPVYQEVLDTYGYRNGQGNIVLCWDHGRYVNHSFNANCLTTAYDFELAIRDIAPGEQLTDDYGYLNIEQPFRGIDEGTRRKTVYPDDLLRYYKVWDKKVADAFRFVASNEQPLRHLIPEDLWSLVQKIINGEQKPESVLTNYYPGAVRGPRGRKLAS